MRAVVDIGSNSIKFTVAELHRSAPAVVKKKSWVTRLGRGLDKTGLLASEAIAETETALIEIARQLEPYRPDLEVQVVATSAVRDCKNPEEISERVQRILNSPLRVLTGLEEARYSLSGASAAAQSLFGTKHCVFIDVGGASTEVGIVEPGFQAFSFQAGAVRCHEALGLDRMPVGDTDWQKAQQGIAGFFPSEKWKPLAAKIPATHTRGVAVGGTLLVAARLAGAELARVADGTEIGFVTTRQKLEEFNDRFRRLSHEQRMAFPNMEKGRADILCAGILCLTEVFGRRGIQEILITDWGLRQGLLMSEPLGV